jgi:hypothetical protein
MTNDEGNPNAEFDIRVSALIRHSTFDIRHLASAFTSLLLVGAVLAGCSRDRSELHLDVILKMSPTNAVIVNEDMGHTNLVEPRIILSALNRTNRLPARVRGKQYGYGYVRFAGTEQSACIDYYGDSTFRFSNFWFRIRETNAIIKLFGQHPGKGGA